MFLQNTSGTQLNSETAFWAFNGNRFIWFSVFNKNYLTTFAECPMAIYFFVVWIIYIRYCYHVLLICFSQPRASLSDTSLPLRHLSMYSKALQRRISDTDSPVWSENDLSLLYSSSVRRRRIARLRGLSLFGLPISLLLSNISGEDLFKALAASIKYYSSQGASSAYSASNSSVSRNTRMLLRYAFTPELVPMFQL